MQQDLPQSRELVSIYCRSTPGVLLRRREIDLDLTKRSNFFNEPRLRKVKKGDIAIFKQTLKHTALRLQCRCHKANSSTCNFQYKQSNVLKSRGVCASNWFFTKHFIKQSKARITNSDILIVAKRWNPEKEDMSSLLICPLKDYVKR